jgi:hypothetical protein
MAFRHLVWPIAKRRYRKLKDRPDRESAAYVQHSETGD